LIRWFYLGSYRFRCNGSSFQGTISTSVSGWLHVLPRMVHYDTSFQSWCPRHKAVAEIPNTKTGWDEAWYLTSCWIGSGIRKGLQDKLSLRK
jgi:hypothetical protein